MMNPKKKYTLIWFLIFIHVSTGFWVENKNGPMGRDGGEPFLAKQIKSWLEMLFMVQLKLSSRFASIHKWVRQIM